MDQYYHPISVNDKKGGTKQMFNFVQHGMIIYLT